jgi:hypothetical protein
MLIVNDKNHTSLVIGSIERIYNKSKIYGKLKIKNLYFIDIIANLLNDKCVTLTTEQINSLLSIYYNITFQSNEICRPTICQIYQSTIKPAFIQAEADDCNDVPSFPKIYFWQELTTTANLANIQPLVNNQSYLSGKLSDTYQSFDTGRTVAYSNIGRICFLATESTTTSYTMYDIMGNDVTNAFDIVLMPLIKSTLFVSKNIYSHGDIYFKIKK